jgi:uncharacterized protein (UPF0261 family)
VTNRSGIWVIGTLDTKREAVEYLADRIRALGCRPIVVDVSLSHTDSPASADIPVSEVATAAGADVAALKEMPRSAAMQHMMTGATNTLVRGYRLGEVRGVRRSGARAGPRSPATPCANCRSECPR